MSSENGAVMAVRMPQMNVNDDEVTVVAWCVEDGGRAVEGEPLCEIETSKAAGELPSPATGVLRRQAQPGDLVRTDGIVGYIGPSTEVVDSHLSMLRSRSAPLPLRSQPCGTVVPLASGSTGTSPSSCSTGTSPSVCGTGVPPVHSLDLSGSKAGTPQTQVEASAGAIEFARRAAVDLSQVSAADGRIRRSDVEKYLQNRPFLTETPGASSPTLDDDLPPLLQESVDELEPLEAHQRAICRHLKETQARLVVAHAMMDVNMSGAGRWIHSRRQDGIIASPLPPLIKAAAAAVSVCPELQRFRLGRRVFRYRSLDVGFTVRSHQGRLYTPVVRAVDRLSLAEISARCGELAMAAFRGQLAEHELAGGCITVSLLNAQPVRAHVGLQNVYQSAILTCGAIRDELRLTDGRPEAVPTVTLCLSYDHGLLDGWDAATALDAARQAIEGLVEED